MKNMFKHIASLGLGTLLLPLAFSADNELSKNPVQLPGIEVRGVDSLPIPIKQSIPRVGKSLVGTTIVMKFTVDKKGRTTRVRSAKPIPSFHYPNVRDFAVQMEQLLNGWKFNPALNSDGIPVIAKVIMPVKVVERDGSTVALATLVLDMGDKDNS